MADDIAALLTSLRAARTFEDACAATLRPMLAVAAEALAHSPFGARGRILRGLVHLRPDGGYRQLVVLERRADKKQGGDGWTIHHNPDLLPSATAWRFVAGERCSVSIDVALGKVEPNRAGSQAVFEKPPAPFGSEESIQRMLGRDATHVLVVPLCAPGGAVDGMISLEASCQAAVGQEFVWRSVDEKLQLLAEVALPHLSRLPVGAAASARVDEFLPVVGKSTAGLIEMLGVFARQEETILIGGPTGAGKSRLARWCHEQSQRRGKRFEVLDLVTIPEELQAGELFGWRKGAFTGAVKENAGCLERAEGGTLFIDEIDKLSLKAQAGLLGVLEERRYRPLGEGVGDRRADVRFMVGANADLQAAVRAGTFREDLFYRINVLPVKLPPLGERRDEIGGWARYMLERRHREAGADGPATIDADVEPLLTARDWPGNLRQLDNIVRRAYTLALLEAGGAPSTVALGRRHVERALQYESSAAPSRSLVDLMAVAADAFVTAAEKKGLDLDLADAFRGFVLGCAVERAGDRDAAFRLVGKEQLVKNRNHHKALKRELERVAELARAVGHQGSPFAPVKDEGE